MILNVYKPKGISSFQCVSEVRRRTKAKKAGHAGTLDPNAEGVLPVMLDKSTRVNEFFMDFDKGYECEILFGKETDTCDIWGETIREEEYSHITREALLEILKNFHGRQKQIPPAYSAIKVDGVPMYKLARKGKAVEPKARDIEIYSIELLSFDGNTARIHVSCSKGTYIRSLCRDIGVALNSAACMYSLVRTHYGMFDCKDAVMLEDIDENYMEYAYPVDLVLQHFPSVEINDKQKTDYINGRSVLINEVFEEEGIRVYHKGELLALARNEKTKDGKTVLKPWKYFGE